MYRLLTRLHLLECDCCGDKIIVDDNELIKLMYDGELDTSEEIEEELDDCDGDCFNCELCI